jgi:hypothetical protein
VTGQAAADRAMRRLSGDRIRVSITCWAGSALTVESDLGRCQSRLLLTLLPTATGTEVTPFFAVSRSRAGAVDALRAATARWLFGAFLQRDVAVLEGMAFRPRMPVAEDRVLLEFLEYVRELSREGEQYHAGKRVSTSA